MMTSQTRDERMTFSLYGNAPHLRLEAASDLEKTLVLDEAHWVATSAPVDTFNTDPAFLSLLDANGDGRISCHDVRDAVRWLLGVLSDLSGVSDASSTLRLSAVNRETSDGTNIASAAGKVLAKIGKPGAEEISLAELRKVKQQSEAVPISESGVVLPDAADEPGIQQFIRDILATAGGVPHPSGNLGVDTDTLNRFLQAVKGFLNWQALGQIPADSQQTDIMPLGKQTGAAYAALTPLKAKLDQYFAQCLALVLDDRFSQNMGWTEAELQSLDLDDPAVIEEVLQKAPLAKATPERTLNLAAAINPFYVERVETFFRETVKPVLGERQSLNAREWQELRQLFSAHENWLQGKNGAMVEPLGAEKLQAYLEPRYAKIVADLIADSRGTAIIMDNLRLIEKVLLFQCHLLRFANNFVSFPELYDTRARALFELGSLVMDGRRFNFAVRVANRAEHVNVAKTSSLCVLYATVMPKDGRPAYEISVPVTSGNKGNLCLGKRGVFYDVDGRENDARILDIIENPISFWEALLSPFKRIGKLLSGKIEAWTTASGNKLENTTSAAFTQVGQPHPGTPTAPAPAGSGAAGMLMGAGVATAALGSATAYIAKTLAETSWLAILTGVLGAVLLVLIPTGIIAFFKLRRRDLSAILEGSGWAINARMRLTSKQGRFFTQHPKYPAGAKGVGRLFWRRVLWLLFALAVLAALVNFLRTRQASNEDHAVQGTPAPVQLDTPALAE
jgi:hypothetical protein